MRRIALINESSTRKDILMEAFMFYQSGRSQWLNAITRYMKVRDFPKKDIYFLSFFEQRIISYYETIEPYPLDNKEKKKVDCANFAKKIVAFIQKFNEPLFIEIHAGRYIGDPLKEILDDLKIPCMIMASVVSLASKPVFYNGLVEDELNKRKLKAIGREKFILISSIRFRTPYDADNILKEYSSRAKLYGVETEMMELKNILYKYNKKKGMKCLR
jgi:hypothetical protein